MALCLKDRLPPADCPAISIVFVCWQQQKIQMKISWFERSTTCWWTRGGRRPPKKYSSALKLSLQQTFEELSSNYSIINNYLTIWINICNKHLKSWVTIIIRSDQIPATSIWRVVRSDQHLLWLRRPPPVRGSSKSSMCCWITQLSMHSWDGDKSD